MAYELIFANYLIPILLAGFSTYFLYLLFKIYKPIKEEWKRKRFINKLLKSRNIEISEIKDKLKRYCLLLEENMPFLQEAVKEDIDNQLKTLDKLLVHFKEIDKILFTDLDKMISESSAGNSYTAYKPYKLYFFDFDNKMFPHTESPIEQFCQKYKYLLIYRNQNRKNVIWESVLGKKYIHINEVRDILPKDDPDIKLLTHLDYRLNEQLENGKTEMQKKMRGFYKFDRLIDKFFNGE